jgi:hypothetical protein
VIKALRNSWWRCLDKILLFLCHDSQRNSSSSGHPIFVFRLDLCLLTEFTLNGAISARCGHFIHYLYHLIPNLHIYCIIIPHFLLHMITSIANSQISQYYCPRVGI